MLCKTAFHVKGASVLSDATVQTSTSTLQLRHQGGLASLCDPVWQLLLSFLTWPDILEVTGTNLLAKAQSVTMLSEALLNAPIPIMQMLYDISGHCLTLRPRAKFNKQILGDLPDYERLQRGFELLPNC